MEVHHHSHTARKKWTNYFWEFLMLFLAVFCGFLAENQREHMIEQKREKHYIKSMVADLEEDTANIAFMIEFNIAKFKGLDSLSESLNNNNFSDSAQLRLFKLNWAYASNMGALSVNERTIRQLLSSGNMRLIHKQKISDSIMRYYGAAKDDLTGQETIYEETMKRVLLHGEDIFDNTYVRMKFKEDSSFIWNPQWNKLKMLTKDSVILKKYSRMIITAQNMIAFYTEMLLDMRKMAADLLHFLKKEYHLE